MRRLILVRHAKTERSAATGEDFDRALDPVGRRAAAAVGERLAGAGLIPAVALVSAARRAQETFELMKPYLPDARAEVSERLYNAAADTLQAEAEADGSDTVMVVAHNPGVHEFALALAARCTMIGVEDRRALEQGFPPGCAAAFEFDGERTGCLGVFAPEPAR